MDKITFKAFSNSEPNCKVSEDTHAGFLILVYKGYQIHIHIDSFKYIKKASFNQEVTSANCIMCKTSDNYDFNICYGSTTFEGLLVAEVPKLKEIEIDREKYGKTVYEAYCAHTGGKSRFFGVIFPYWSVLAKNSQEAWIAAGLAVAEMSKPEETNSNE